MSEPQFSEPPSEVLHIHRAEGGASWRLAARKRTGAGPTLVWLGGFRSDMLATKAGRLDDWAKAQGRAFLRFDYSGHGESEGAFEEGTIGRWTRDALAVIDALAAGDELILVGSSMGGWIALLVARALAERGEEARLKGLTLIAPAADFTQALLWPQLPEAAKREIETTGSWMRPSAYSSEPYPITRALIEDGRAHLLMGGPVRAYAPVHILQGMADPDVPWTHAQALFEKLAFDPAVLTYVKDGDHRLSREEDLRLLIGAVAAMG